MRVAALQYGVGSDPAANLATCLRMLAEGAAQGAEVMVTPEFANHVSWYDDRDHARRMACTIDGEFITAVAAAAREHGAYVCLNVTLARSDGRTTGTNIFFAPTGEILGASDKQVLMGSERDHLDGAIEGADVYDTELARFGTYSCMDGVIYETPRMLAIKGAQVLLNSLNSFALDEASLHIPVRAPESRVWIVAANKVGPLVPAERLEMVSAAVGVPVSMLHGAGDSQIVAPDGTVVAQGPRTGEAVVIADIEVALADNKVRPDGTHLIAARRPEIYGPIAAEPKGRIAPAGAPDLNGAVVTDVESIKAAIGAGAALVVLPELVGDPSEVAALLPNDVHVVMSIREGGAHVGLVVGAEGVLHRQVALHRAGRHEWQTELGNEVEICELPWGRLAVLAGDDTLYPEGVRLAALVDADVVAAPWRCLEAWERRTGLVERAAENRVNLLAASVDTDAGAGFIAGLSYDFTLWGDWQDAFAGSINYPEVTLAEGAATLATLRPGAATNRLVSRGTDVVDGRPWNLVAGVLTS